MAAFFLRDEKLILRFEYGSDTLTVYRLFASKKETLEGESAATNVAVDSDSSGDSDVIHLRVINSNPDVALYERAIEQIIQPDLGFSEFIQDNHASHPHLHIDGLDSSEPHYHLKFQSALTKEQLVKILDIFFNHKLLAKDGKEMFLHFLDAAIADALEAQAFAKELIDNAVKNVFKTMAIQQLDVRLNAKTVEAVRQPFVKRHWRDGQSRDAVRYNEVVVQCQQTDLKTIINFISGCTDSDLLISLYSHLKSAKFNYLRQLVYPLKKHETFATAVHKWVPFSQWQGSTSLTSGIDRISLASKLVVETTECWATIEKAFATKLAYNVHIYDKGYTPETADQYAKQLASAHGFFSIPRSTLKSGKKTNKLYDAFVKCNRDKLEEKHRKVFSRS